MSMPNIARELLLASGLPRKIDAFSVSRACATSTQALADQASWISYGPSRKSSVPLIKTYTGTDIQMAQHMPTAPQNIKNALASDDEWWADHQDEVLKRYSAWMAK